MAEDVAAVEYGNCYIVLTPLKDADYTICPVWATEIITHAKNSVIKVGASTGGEGYRITITVGFIGEGTIRVKSPRCCCCRTSVEGGSCTTRAPEG